MYHWTTCPLSHQPLKEPVVSDLSGKLYNKDAILEFLLPAGDGTPGLSKSDNEEVLEGRVRSLRDVVEVKFQLEEEDGVDKSGKASPEGPKWVCPITNKTLGPGVKAVYLVPCGHAFLESAIREVSGENCLQVSGPLYAIDSSANMLQCNEPFTADNVITILPSSVAEQERLVSRAQKLKDQGLTHSLKKAPGSGKKRKKNGDGPAERLDHADELLKTLKETISANGSMPGSGTSTPGGVIKHAATASLTAKVLAEQQEKNKRRKLAENKNLKSLFSSDNGVPKKDGDFMTRGFSIPAGAKR